ncbi:MAG: FGGY family carbohydrate kinase [Bryobacteraceae bacterium]
MANFIGIDAGTSFLKGAVLNLDALTIRDHERVPFPAFLPGLPEGYREVDPNQILRAVDELLDRLTRRTSDCHGIVLCGQMHGCLLVNERGEAASNYFSWLDARVSVAEFEELSGRIPPPLRSELGNEFRSSIAVSLLYSMKRRGLLPPGSVTPVSVADFIAAHLCAATPVMEPTQAAAFGALRLTDLQWHPQVIGRLDLGSLRWPPVRPTGSVAGYWRGVPCYTAIGDQQCALAGALLAENELSINIGTGSQVAVIADLGLSDCQTRPYFDGRFLRTITHIPGGRALSALIGLLTDLAGISEEDAWRKIDAAVDSVPATDLRAGLAFYPGPCGSSGFLENLHERNLTAGHVFRAAYESMAHNYAACMRRLNPAHKPARIVFSGGVARRRALLRDLTATEMNLSHRLSPHPEDTLMGLLVYALASSGRAESVSAAARRVAEALSYPG